MSRSTTQVRDFLDRYGVLEDGERVVATCRAMPLGGVKAWAKRSGKAARFGLIGAAVMLFKDSRVPVEDYAEAAAQGVFLAVTDRRLIVLNSRGARPVPTALLASVPRLNVVGLTEGTTKVGLFRLANVDIGLDDGTNVGFEFSKADASEGRAVVDALR